MKEKKLKRQSQLDKKTTLRTPQNQKRNFIPSYPSSLHSASLWRYYSLLETTCMPLKKNWRLLKML